MDTVDVGKIICSFDESLISVVFPALFKKGNPLLDRFNILMRRYLQAGLLEMHWTELQYQASLRVAGRLREVGGDVFFAFSVSHLMPAFVVLLVGNVLSSVVFIGELILNSPCRRRIKKKLRLKRVRLLNLLNRTNYRFWSILLLAGTFQVFWRTVFVCIYVYMYVCEDQFCSITNICCIHIKNNYVISSLKFTMWLTGHQLVYVATPALL